MKRFLIVLLVTYCLPVVAEPVALKAEDWARPRSGEALAQRPELARLVQTFDRDRQTVIVITHNTGEEGQLWAEELRGWLVALGVTSARIRLEARVAMPGVLSLDLGPPS